MVSVDKKKFENTKEFIGRGNHLSKVYLKDKKFEYYDLPSSLEPRLPNFVLCLTCETNREYLLGVSTSVPEHFRPYWAVHDYIENVEQDNPDSEGCLKALEKELSLVPEIWKRDYLPLSTHSN